MTEAYFCQKIALLYADQLINDEIARAAKFNRVEPYAEMHIFPDAEKVDTLVLSSCKEALKTVCSSPLGAASAPASKGPNLSLPRHFTPKSILAVGGLVVAIASVLVGSISIDHFIEIILDLSSNK